MQKPRPASAPKPATASADSWPTLVQRGRRGALLSLLEQSPGHTAPAHLMVEGLRLSGYVVSADLLMTELHWLAEQGLLLLTQGSRVTVVQLTARGLDVVSRRAIVPGVSA